MEPIRLGGAELAVVGGLLGVLAGTVSALWVAYSRSTQSNIAALQSRILGLVQDRDMLRAIAWEAVELATALVQSHSPEKQSTPEQRALVKVLRRRLLLASEAATPQPPPFTG